MKIQIDLKAADFEQLWTNSMEWVNQDWQKQVDRFDPSPLFSWKYAYWFDNYASLKMAEAYLNGVGSARGLSETHSDESGGWVLLTNYPSISWLKNHQLAVNA